MDTKHRPFRFISGQAAALSGASRRTPWTFFEACGGRGKNALPTGYATAHPDKTMRERHLWSLRPSSVTGFHPQMPALRCSHCSERTVIRNFAQCSLGCQEPVHRPFYELSRFLPTTPKEVNEDGHISCWLTDHRGDRSSPCILWLLLGRVEYRGVGDGTFE